MLPLRGLRRAPRCWILDSRCRRAARQAIGPGPRSPTGRIQSFSWQWLDTCLITYACLPTSCIQFFLLCSYTVFGIRFLLEPRKSVNVPNIPLDKKALLFRIKRQIFERTYKFGNDIAMKVPIQHYDKDNSRWTSGYRRFL